MSRFENVKKVVCEEGWEGIDCTVMSGSESSTVDVRKVETEGYHRSFRDTLHNNDDMRITFPDGGRCDIERTTGGAKLSCEGKRP